MTAGPALKVGIVEPNRDAAGLAGLVALGAAAASAGAARRADHHRRDARPRRGSHRRLGRPAGPLPEGGRTGRAAAGLSAAPLSEQALITYNRTGPAVKLAGHLRRAGPDRAGLPVRRHARDHRRLAAAGRAVAGGADRGEVPATAWATPACATLRAPPAAGRSRSCPARRRPSPWDSSTAPPSAGRWAPGPRSPDRPGCSPSSTSRAPWRPRCPVPVGRPGGRSRWRRPSRAWRSSTTRGRSGCGPSPPNSTATRTTASSADRIDGHAAPPVAAALGTVSPIPNGQTGLYDTVLAAYTDRRGPGGTRTAVNSVVLLTDGQNQDPTGLTLDQLVEELKAVIDPRKPIQVIAIGIGDEVSQAELERITGPPAAVRSSPATRRRSARSSCRRSRCARRCRPEPPCGRAAAWHRRPSGRRRLPLTPHGMPAERQPQVGEAPRPRPPAPRPRSPGRAGTSPRRPRPTTRRAACATSRTGQASRPRAAALRADRQLPAVPVVVFQANPGQVGAGLPGLWPGAPRARMGAAIRPCSAWPLTAL